MYINCSHTKGIFMIVMSACLAGRPVRYDGCSCENEISNAIIERNDCIVYICPELLGGLSIPRCPCEIFGGNAVDVINGHASVINNKGEIRTEEFLKGAYLTLNIIKGLKPEVVYLKSKSPSCGLGKIYDGTFTGNLIQGNGITAQLLIDNGINVISI